ncbi:hypothetical protein BN871_AC_00350 [Paenibacillus sp. P22]|nr:hypothetical protein BN871_AC_00350 [Paenibacillus sp. P22]
MPRAEAIPITSTAMLMARAPRPPKRLPADTDTPIEHGPGSGSAERHPGIRASGDIRASIRRNAAAGALSYFAHQDRQKLSARQRSGHSRHGCVAGHAGRRRVPDGLDGRQRYDGPDIQPVVPQGASVSWRRRRIAAAAVQHRRECGHGTYARTGHAVRRCVFRLGYGSDARSRRLLDAGRGALSGPDAARRSIPLPPPGQQACRIRGWRIDLSPAPAHYSRRAAARRAGKLAGDDPLGNLLRVLVAGGPPAGGEAARSDGFSPAGARARGRQRRLADMEKRPRGAGRSPQRVDAAAGIGACLADGKKAVEAGFAGPAP